MSLFFRPMRYAMAERIMFQFALHSHATENVTVLYLTRFHVEALVGRYHVGERMVGRSIDLDNFGVDRSKGLLTRLLKI